MADDVLIQRIDRDLAQADWHIAQAEALIARQQNVLDELHRAGHDTEAARNLLEIMLESLRQMHAHRRLIEAEAGRLRHAP
jgi:hypothetical protein